MSCGDNELSANVKFEFFLDRTPVCNPLYSHIVKDEVIIELLIICDEIVRKYRYARCWCCLMEVRACVSIGATTTTNRIAIFVVLILYFPYLHVDQGSGLHKCVRNW